MLIITVNETEYKIPNIDIKYARLLRDALNDMLESGYRGEAVIDKAWGGCVTTELESEP